MRTQILIWYAATDLAECLVAKLILQLGHNVSVPLLSLIYISSWASSQAYTTQDSSFVCVQEG